MLPAVSPTVEPASFTHLFTACQQSRKASSIDCSSSLNTQSPKICSTTTAVASTNTATTTITTATTTTRRRFSEDEDNKLRYLVSKYGERKWANIAKKMGGNRSASQCRDRYKNYLKPGIFNGQWTNEEDQILLKKYQEMGPQWAKIAACFENRNSNALKNRWNYFLSHNYLNVLELGKKNQVLIENCENLDLCDFNNDNGLEDMIQAEEDFYSFDLQADESYAFSFPNFQFGF